MAPARTASTPYSSFCLSLMSFCIRLLFVPSSKDPFFFFRQPGKREGGAREGAAILSSTMEKWLLFKVKLTEQQC